MMRSCTIIPIILFGIFTINFKKVYSQPVSESDVDVPIDYRPVKFSNQIGVVPKESGIIDAPGESSMNNEAELLTSDTKHLISVLDEEQYYDDYNYDDNNNQDTPLTSDDLGGDGFFISSIDQDDYQESEYKNYDSDDSHYDYNYDTVDYTDLTTADVPPVPFVNPILYSERKFRKNKKNRVSDRNRLGFGTTDDLEISKKSESQTFLMDASSERETKCDHVCSNRINFNDKMFINPICSTNGQFYDSQTKPSLACDRCTHNIEIDRESKYIACENSRTCVEGKSSWKCPWW